MSSASRSYSLFAAQLVALFCVYLISSRWIEIVEFPLDIHRLIWPSAGIAVASLFLFGLRLWPAVFAASLVANALLGIPLSAAAAIGAGSALKGVVGAWLLESFQFNPQFNRLKDSLALIAIALSASVISAAIGASALATVDIITLNELPTTWTSWWIGDFLGILIVGAFLLRWLTNPPLLRTIAQYIEIAAFLAISICTALLVFWRAVPELGVVPQYMLFVPVSWGALRIGPRFMTLALGTIAAIAITATVAGYGPYGESAATGDLFGIQLFIATLSFIALLFVSAVEERKEIMRGLQKSVVSLTEDVHVISEADRAKNEFIATLSHELRNPLAPILSTLEIMRMRITDNGLTPLIETSRENVMRITRLLDDLLDVASISGKQISLQMADVHLRSIIEHAIVMARPLMEKQSHSFTEDLPPEEIIIHADSLRIEQVVVNLLNNAAKYTPRGGQISLSCSRSGSYAVIRIRDNGIGIAHADQMRIFEPFRQVHGGASPAEATGLGIGLSLAKRLVELHGGTIMVESQGVGQGSEFSIRLPIVATPTEPAAAALATIELPAEISQKGGRKVLIVDDNAEAAKAIAQLLNHSGHNAEVAFSGAEALQIVARFVPDIVFLDISLPDGNGYDIARTIRDYLAPAPRIIALSGYSHSPETDRDESVFDGRLVKPVSIADLEKILAHSA